MKLAAAVFFSVYMIAYALAKDNIAVYIAIAVTCLALYIDQGKAVTETVDSAISSVANKDTYDFAAVLPLDSSIGVNFSNGIRAAFMARNINGAAKKFKLVTKTDKGISKLTAEATKNIVNKKTLGLITIGHDQTIAAAAAVSDRCVHLFPHTPSTSLRLADNEFFNKMTHLAPSYYIMAKYIIGYLHGELGLKTYGVFRDSNSNAEAIELILQAKGTRIASEGVYDASAALDVDRAFRDSIDSNPKVVIVISDIESVVNAYIKLARDKGYTGLIAVFSLENFEIEPDYRNNVITITNVPDPANVKLQISTSFKSDRLLIESFNENEINQNKLLIKKNDRAAFAGYILGRYLIELVELVESTDGDVTPETLNNAAVNAGVYNIDDYMIESFSNTNQLMTYVFINRGQDGIHVPIEYTPDDISASLSESFVRN